MCICIECSRWASSTIRFVGENQFLFWSRGSYLAKNLPLVISSFQISRSLVCSQKKKKTRHGDGHKSAVAHLINPSWHTVPKLGCRSTVPWRSTRSQSPWSQIPRSHISRSQNPDHKQYIMAGRQNAKNTWIEIQVAKHGYEIQQATH